MSIKFVILGYLSWRPMTGYDVKKIIANSEVLPWSASNNQIYQALVQLHHEEWVTKSIEDQIGKPDRHVYTITNKGLQVLQTWAGSAPELPQAKKPLLHQLMWADGLEADALDELLDAYLNVVGEKLFLMRVQADRKTNMPERSDREKYLWDMIHKNWIDQYELELNWIRELRQELSRAETQRQWAQS
jgi:PadR family transcriptional regulator, regulatory protein AphA